MIHPALHGFTCAWWKAPEQLMRPQVSQPVCVRLRRDISTRSWLQWECGHMVSACFQLEPQHFC